MTLNRLTIVGPVQEIKKFEQTDWRGRCAARYFEILECRPTRSAWQFESDNPPLPPLKEISLCHPRLTFLLDYEQEKLRTKGLAKAAKGELTHHRVNY